MPETVRIHCNECGHETNHAVCCSHTRVEQDIIEAADASFEIRDTFDVLQCLGCEHIAVRRHLIHELYGEDEAVLEFYPPRISRPMPRWKSKLPPDLAALVGEVYRTLWTGSPRLATIGARTVVDVLLLDIVGDVGTFEQKLTALEDRGYVGRRSREFVQAALEAGSAAAHRGIAPQDVDLNKVMDIVENLLESAYVLEEAAEHLREVTPPRASQRRKS